MEGAGSPVASHKKRERLPAPSKFKRYGSEFYAERFFAIPFGPNSATVLGRDVGSEDDFLVVICFVHLRSFLFWT